MTWLTLCEQIKVLDLITEGAEGLLEPSKKNGNYIQIKINEGLPEVYYLQIYLPGRWMSYLLAITQCFVY